MRENQDRPQRITRIDLFKYSLFILLIGQLLKLEMESMVVHGDRISAAVRSIESNTTGQRNVTVNTAVRWDRVKTMRTEQEPVSTEQRIVILPGPHKSASTSVQIYLVQLAKKGTLKQHSWAWLGKESSKGFSFLARHLLYAPEFEEDKDKVEKFKQLTKKEWDAGNNLVIAAEFMDYVASLSEKDASMAIGRLLNWLPAHKQAANRIETVIMYRSPRASHLISAWKQQNQFRKASSTLPWRESLAEKAVSRKKFGASPTLAEWLCYGIYPEAMKYDVETILSAQLSPFGVAYAYSKYGSADVTLIDMSGVPNGDVPSSVVCDILGLPCEDGKLAAGDIEPSQKNHKSEKAELGMTDAHLEEAEELIRDSDCYYYCLLGDKVAVLYGIDEIFHDGNMSWEKCCQRAKKKNEDANGKWMAKQLIELGCRAIAESRTTMN